MSRYFLFALLTLTVAGLLWGAHGDSPDGAAADNNERSETKMQAIADGGSDASPLSRLPYSVLRATRRVPRALFRLFAWLPRRLAANASRALYRLMSLFRDYATDALGYLASSERTDLARVRRDVPAVAEPSGPPPRRPGLDVVSLMFKLMTFPMKMAVRTTFVLLGFTPVGGLLELLSGLMSAGGVVMRNPLVVSAGDVGREVADYAVAVAWNFTKSNVLPRLDVFVNELKESDAAPKSLMTFLVELQTLYHVFKLLGMA